MESVPCPLEKLRRLKVTALSRDRESTIVVILTHIFHRNQITRWHKANFSTCGFHFPPMFIVLIDKPELLSGTERQGAFLFGRVAIERPIHVIIYWNDWSQAENEWSETSSKYQQSSAILVSKLVPGFLEASALDLVSSAFRPFQFFSTKSFSSSIINRNCVNLCMCEFSETH